MVLVPNVHEGVLTKPEKEVHDADENDRSDVGIVIIRYPPCSIGFLVVTSNTYAVTAYETYDEGVIETEESSALVDWIRLVLDP